MQILSKTLPHDKYYCYNFARCVKCDEGHNSYSDCKKSPSQIPWPSVLYAQGHTNRLTKDVCLMKILRYIGVNVKPAEIAKIITTHHNNIHRAAQILGTTSSTPIKNPKYHMLKLQATRSITRSVI